MNVLVADDDLTTRLTLQGVLSAWGYPVVVACDGAEAWEILQRSDSPALILLDWLMPGKDGIELCRLIRSTPELSGKYVMLLSSLSEKADMLAGLEAGANDFMSKPFDANELLCRLRVGERVLAYQSKIREQADCIAGYATQMEKLAEERAQQLVHADRLATIGLLSARLAHEINNPVAFIAGNRTVLHEFWGHIHPRLIAGAIAEASGAGAAELGERTRLIVEEFPKALAGIQKGIERIQLLTKSLKRHARKESSQRRRCAVADVIRNTQEFCASVLGPNARIHVRLSEHAPDLCAHPEQIEQVLINMVTNAVDAARPRGDVSIWISAAESNGQLEITVEDNGPGFSETALAKLWEPFFTTKGAEHGTGLGLSISRSIVESHGGSISAANRPGGGACITIRLPKSV